MSSPKAPSAPDPAKSFASGIQTYLKYSPKLLRAEEAARAQYDPQRIAEQQALQTQFGPTQYAQQLQALQQLDPTGTALRTQLGGTISDALQRGYLDPLQQQAYQALGKSTTGGLLAGSRQTPQQLAEDIATVRAGAAARGNITGNAPATAEALYAGQRGQQLLAQRQAVGAQFAGMQSPLQGAITNAGMFQGLQTPAQQVAGIQGVQPDRASAYVNPNAGYLGQQFGLQNYPNQAYAQQGSANPWMGALSGAAGGAATGTMISPGYGTAIGAVVGGLGGYFSDEKLKQNISRAGRVTKDGIPIVEFNYKGDKTRYRGVIAQDVQKVRPDAVFDFFGTLKVDYQKLGLKLEVI